MGEPVSKLTERLREWAEERRSNYAESFASTREARAWEFYRVQMGRFEDVLAATSALEQAEKALRGYLNSHGEDDGLACSCHHCQVAREAFAVLAGQNKQEQA